MDESPQKPKCGCPCHMMTGIFVALIGLTFLLGALNVLGQRIVSIAWPIGLILIGLQNSIGKGRCKCCEKA